MEESKLEKRLVDKIESWGGKCFKWVSPGKRGVPDRICLLPGGQIHFVEMKAPGEKPSPLQKKRHQELRKLGFLVHILDSKQQVDDFINQIAR